VSSMSKFVRQFRKSFKVGDVLTDGTTQWTVYYIGNELVVMTTISNIECVFWERSYAWRKVKP